MERKPRNFKKILLILLAIAVVMMVYAFIEPFLLRTDRITYRSPDVPGEFDGFKILFAADIHSGPYMGKERVLALGDRINAENPDIVILGGDYIKDALFQLEPVVEMVSRIEAPVYFVLGNHEYRTHVVKCVDMLTTIAGGVYLENRQVKIERGGEAITLVGMDDYSQLVGRAGEALAEAYAGVKAEDFVILVEHWPHMAEEMDEGVTERTDLMLSGHTHGSQLTPFGLYDWAGDYLLPLYRSSLRTDKEPDRIVTNGVGTSFLPVRFFAPPQIHVITLAEG